AALDREPARLAGAQLPPHAERQPVAAADPVQRSVSALEFQPGRLLAIDQTALPATERWLELGTAAEVAAAITRLSIRGAPLIGVAAAYGVALDVARNPTHDTLVRASRLLAAARPTAVNLAAA